MIFVQKYISLLHEMIKLLRLIILVELNISPNIVKAVDEAKNRKMSILGIVGRDGGYTKLNGDLVLVIPSVNEERITPHSEEFQAIIWHCLSCHPSLSKNKNKWEGMILK